MNKKIKQIPAYEQIFEYMRNAIKENQWKIGEKIPSEIELSNEFGVNRLTVRMALQRLNSMGLVETRTGDGTYVKQFNFRDYIDNITDFYMTPDLINKVTAFRRAVELECAKLAIQEATEEEI
ncbi:MAG: GntR family transcriptional regulator, partial [Clostridia bacterium]|nr:GntR family transcriptional regulator [Clostridia bacterium]